MQWTTDNLEEHALRPVMQWLIGAAQDRSTITYGQAAERLLGMGFDANRRAALRVGEVVPGRIMPRIRDGHGEGVPPLNVLLVNKRETLPGIGVCRDLASWYRVDKGTVMKKNRRTGAQWEAMCRQAMSAVYAYPRWKEVFWNVWGEDFPQPDNPESISAPNPREPDGFNLPGAGEGKAHRRLRERIVTHPEVIDCRYEGRPTATGVVLKSGDRVDVVIYTPDGAVAVEVKSRVSNEADLERGVYQCLKYRTIMDAMGMKTRGMRTIAVLVTESDLPRRLRKLADDHAVTHVRVGRPGQGSRTGTRSGSGRGTSPETVFGMLSRPGTPGVSVEALSESAASGWAGET